MTEPITTLGIGALAAYLGKDGLEKLLGPTADYLGNSLRDFTQQRAANIGRIFRSAQAKLGDTIDTPGEVPPKVLRAVLNEGSYANDSVAVEYFGGILASARTEHGRDDRGARLAKLLDGLSSYQLRTHFLLYSTVRRIFSDSGLPFNMEGRPKMQIFVPFSDFISTMEFSAGELQQLAQLLNHIFFGLAADNLIEDHWQYGPYEHISKMFEGASPDGGIVCGPSALGAELFLSAFGYAQQSLNGIFDKTLKMAVDGVPDGFPSALRTKN